MRISVVSRWLRGVVRTQCKTVSGQVCGGTRATRGAVSRMSKEREGFACNRVFGILAD
jgi:hypothetical protein